MDRVKTYTRINLETGFIQKLEFERAHFKEAGVPETPVYGMPKLTALILVNKWNQQSILNKYYVEF